MERLRIPSYVLADEPVTVFGSLPIFTEPTLTMDKQITTIIPRYICSILNGTTSAVILFGVGPDLVPLGNVYTHQELDEVIRKVLGGLRQQINPHLNPSVCDFSFIPVVDRDGFVHRRVELSPEEQTKLREKKDAIGDRSPIISSTETISCVFYFIVRPSPSLFHVLYPDKKLPHIYRLRAHDMKVEEICPLKKMRQVLTKAPTTYRGYFARAPSFSNTQECEIIEFLRFGMIKRDIDPRPKIVKVISGEEFRLHVIVDRVLDHRFRMSKPSISPHCMINMSDYSWPAKLGVEEGGQDRAEWSSCIRENMSLLLLTQYYPSSVPPQHTSPLPVDSAMSLFPHTTTHRAPQTFLSFPFVMPQDTPHNTDLLGEGLISRRMKVRERLLELSVAEQLLINKLRNAVEPLLVIFHPPAGLDLTPLLLGVPRISVILAGNEDELDGEDNEQRIATLSLSFGSYKSDEQEEVWRLFTDTDKQYITDNTLTPDRSQSRPSHFPFLNKITTPKAQIARSRSSGGSSDETNNLTALTVSLIDALGPSFRLEQAEELCAMQGEDADEMQGNFLLLFMMFLIIPDTVGDSPRVRCPWHIPSDHGWKTKHLWMVLRAVQSVGVRFPDDMAQCCRLVTTLGGWADSMLVDRELGKGSGDILNSSNSKSTNGEPSGEVAMSFISMCLSRLDCFPPCFQQCVVKAQSLCSILFSE